MPDDMRIGGEPAISNQPRDERGRYSHVVRGVAGIMYCPETRTQWRQMRENDRIISGRPIRRDHFTRALYVPLEPEDMLARLPAVTPRAWTVTVGALVDLGTSMWIGWQLEHKWSLLHGTPLGDWRTLAIAAYFGCLSWFGVARFVLWIWPEAERVRDTFPTIDQIADHEGWPRWGFDSSGRWVQRPRKRDELADHHDHDDAPSLTYRDEEDPDDAA